MKKQLGNATFDVSLSTQDYGGEVVGECCWTVSVPDLRKIFARFPNMEHEGSIPESIGNVIHDNNAETFAELLDEESISFRDADAGILFVAAMAEMGGKWSIHWEGENATWFFHDWDHATHDTEVGINGPKIVRIDADRERRAQVNGAREALKAGISVDDVCEAVASILDEYKTRFGTRLESIWSDIFQGKKLTTRKKKV